MPRPSSSLISLDATQLRPELGAGSDGLLSERARRRKLIQVERFPLELRERLLLGVITRRPVPSIRGRCPVSPTLHADLSQAA